MYYYDSVVINKNVFYPINRISESDIINLQSKDCPYYEVNFNNAGKIESIKKIFNNQISWKCLYSYQGECLKKKEIINYDGSIITEFF